MRKVLAVAFLMASISAFADKGIGAVLNRDAVTYTNSKAEKIEYQLKAGTIFGFLTFSGGWGEHKEKNGYFYVAFFVDNDGKGLHKTTWVKEEDLEFFQYECTAKATTGFWRTEVACVPVEGTSEKWGLQFKIAAKDACKGLGITLFKGSVFVETAATPPPTVASPPAKEEEPPSEVPNPETK